MDMINILCVHIWNCQRIKKIFFRKKAKVFTAHRSKHRREVIPRPLAAEKSKF